MSIISKEETPNYMAELSNEETREISGGHEQDGSAGSGIISLFERIFCPSAHN
jgi:hypothetical protein